MRRLAPLIIFALLALLPQWAAAAYALMISTFTKTTISATSLAIGLWICTDFAKHAFGMAPFLFTSYLDTPWRVFESRCDLVMVAWMPELLNIIIASLSAIGLFTAISIWFFARRDLRS